MSANIAIDQQISVQTKPWYRYGWPWFLISIPMVSVVLGCMMLYLAFNTNNSLVVDDYYKEGKAYNLRIERDRLASLLGVDATLTQSSEGLLLDLEQRMPGDLPQSLAADANAAQSAFVMPDSLSVRWVHVTQAERDGATQMSFIGGNRYIAQNVNLPQPGKFRLHISPLGTPDSISTAPTAPDGTVPTLSSWRLISKLEGFDTLEAIHVPAPTPYQVFTRAMLE